MRRGVEAVAIALVVCVPVVAAAADIFKCTDAAGKVEYRAKPCDQAAEAKKLDVPNNSVDGRVDPRVAQQTKAWDDKMAKQQQDREAAAAQQSKASDAYYAYCQPFIDQIRRASVWLSSPTEIEREAAANEIRIARQRMADANCRENMPPR